MGGMASWWAGELLLLFPSVSPVTLQATRRVCKGKEEYIITRQRQEGKEYCCIFMPKNMLRKKLRTVYLYFMNIICQVFSSICFQHGGKEWQLIYPSEAFYPRSADYPRFKRHSREDPSQEVVFQPNTKIPPSCSQIPNTLLQRLGNQYHGPHRYNKIKKVFLEHFLIFQFIPEYQYLH